MYDWPAACYPVNKAPRMEVVYVTFARDYEWLRYSLQSFKKYGAGFSGVTIVVPLWDLDKFLPFEKEFGTPQCPVLIKNFLEYPSKGFVHHLAMKCYADAFVSDTTQYVLFMDPDCLFSSPVTPEDYLVDGKPVLVIEPYEALKTTHPARYNWKSVTEDALKFNCTHETMCRHPAVHYCWALRDMRAWIEYKHKTPFIDFVLKQKNSYPQGFGEFNTIGAFVHRERGNKYHFIDRGDQGEKNDPPSKVTQMWSYTGVSKNMDQIKKILG